MKKTSGIIGHPNARLTTRERFEMKVDRTGGCHRWTASHNPDGYGQFWLDGRVQSAHVVALLLEGVEIPPGMQVDHVLARGCRHRDCVRVDHLEVVTSRENLMRGSGVAAANAHKATCKRGHPFSPQTNPNQRGSRVCLTCRRMANAAQRSRAKAAVRTP